MTDLADLAARIVTGDVEVFDLTSPLHADTPVLALPEPMGQTAGFELEEISRYDDRGPAWYWNNFRTGEHTGTHFDAPNHWVTGRDLDDVSRVPAQRLVGPAVVIDRTAEAAAEQRRQVHPEPAAVALPQPIPPADRVVRREVAATAPFPG